MKKLFKKYGKVEDFSWKGKYFFVVIRAAVFNVCRPTRLKKRLKKQFEK